MHEGFSMEDLRKAHPDALTVIGSAEQEIARLCGKPVALICYMKGGAAHGETQPIH